MGSSGCYLRVVMLPWLAHGHISPFLELAKQLAHRNVSVYCCSTTAILSSIKTQLDETMFPEIKLVELQLPDFPKLPPHYHTTLSLPTHLMPTLKEAFDSAEPAFSILLKTLNPDCLIYDLIQPWAPAVASELNIPAIQFLTAGAACTSYMYHLSKSPEKGEEFPFPTIQLYEFETQKIQQMLRVKENGITDLERFSLCMDRSTKIVAIKTFRDIEGKFIDYLSVSVGKEIVPVGPLVHQPRNKNQNQPCRITEWLEQRQRGSVVFVSFGSEYFMSREENAEIAEGLELSGQNFIWVVRLPKLEKDGEQPVIEEALPVGFLERIEKKGMVVTGWAEQGEILKHPSTGGFLTHCGWGSIMEGLKLGVPLIALPLQLDQPINAKLAVAELGVAVEIERESSSGRFTGEKVAKGIRTAMMEKEGEGVRKAAKEMSELLSSRGEEEIDVFVNRLRKICRESKERENGLGERAL